ncbi:peroxidase-related enzyme [Natrinema longum]|uniref:Peroxidase-related enzyme n=1 Tax=Natrinema longum TaxID=370324 RepID=A0A8A2UCH1_9EURY|nr:peroxidase-related enzyme [Natrinema longum]MBZ6495771.1 peroxidase-related enzyme [Natrinema longum]QSW86284.1 peroxidase-related enzyme [Natrinema longum]
MGKSEPESESTADDTPELSDDAMGRFPVPAFDDLPEDLRERIEAETDRAGFTPNVFSAFAYKPSHFRAFFQYHDALVEDTALEREEIEMIVVAVSGVNHCYYCNVAHGALVRIYAEDPTLADQLIANYRTADINAAHRTMLDVAVTLTERPTEIEESDLEALREAGFSEEAIWDIAAVTAYYNMSNRMATFAEMRPNDEFHTLGRE